MTFEKWCRAAWPKIKGGYNLHKHLSNLAFSIMLSSVTGVVGNPSQANYGAGGAFLDALARHRSRNGQPAVVLDLGVVLSAGYVADMEKAGDQSVRTRVEKRGFVSVDISQALRVVEAAIRDPLRKSPHDSQVVIGRHRAYDRRLGPRRPTCRPPIWYPAVGETTRPRAVNGGGNWVHELDRRPRVRTVRPCDDRARGDRRAG